MFTTLKNAFRIKDIRHKIGFTFLMLIIIRLGSTIPVPGINVTVFQNWFKELSSNNALGFMDRFTGGSFEKMSILALNITPYITSSIIIQLLTIAIPKFEEWQRDGEEATNRRRPVHDAGLGQLAWDRLERARADEEHVGEAEPQVHEDDGQLRPRGEADAARGSHGGL